MSALKEELANFNVENEEVNVRVFRMGSDMLLQFTNGRSCFRMALNEPDTISFLIGIADATKRVFAGAAEAAEAVKVRD